MKYLFLMGNSGSGKGKLAKNLENYAPDKFHKVVETTTRIKRDDEIDGIDYHFKNDEEFTEMFDKLFATCSQQYYPIMYGCEYSELKTDKWNVMVVSIEGFLMALKNLMPGDAAVLLNIVVENQPKVSGEDNLFDEQTINSAVIGALEKNKVISLNGNRCHYCEISATKLSRVINNSALCMSMINDMLNNSVKFSVREQIRNAETYLDLAYVFIDNSNEIGESSLLLDCLTAKLTAFKKSVEDICNDARQIVQERYKNNV